MHCLKKFFIVLMTIMQCCLSTVKGHPTGDVVKLFIIMINYYYQCAVKGSCWCKDDERDTLYRIQAGGNLPYLHE